MLKQVYFLNPTGISIPELAERYHKHPGPYSIAEEDLQRIFPGIENIKMIYPSEHTKGDTSFANYCLLMRLVKHLKPKITVEIGTFRGKTTYGIAKNAPLESLTITIGLPLEQMTGLESNYGTDRAYFLKKSEIGSYYKETPEEHRIKQIYGDSHNTECQKCLDEILRGQQINLAFIDGAHDYESLKQDFEKVILPRLASDGVVVIDDYSNLSTQPGVASYLTEKARDDNYVFYWCAPFPPPNDNNSSCALYLNTKEARDYEWKDSTRVS